MPLLSRRLAPLALLSFLAALGPACTAELEEGCLGGQCVPPGSPPIPPLPTSDGGGGAGGGGGGDAGPTCEDTPATGDFPCDVFTVLQTHCHGCHQSPPLNNAPYSLLTYEDTRLPHGMTTKPRFVRMAEVVESGFMPLMATLPEADKQILLDWLSTCGLPAEGMGCE
ncbi:hypothetical protein [Polyangium jinanense]|uniref:Cytochrome c domain-containing protein n=1 Tax=Polyangium jinanense TaxID=2829994 RepID=A0A9X3X3X6_9BACT|nr:hypothetical protein [Polyangium jinanense]MDC3955890.1 hypothetical protein [Polyangium jinanense]MDC3983249.1 hypothetical protein [Polyangium jinanense]MDC3985171.1 hypothetical protein [Polyangium jinanense]